MKYRKKPVVVNAVQLSRGNGSALLDFMEETGFPFEIVGPETVLIHTREGDLLASRDDWIIQGVQGEFYPCKPDIFDQTYEAVLNAG